MFKAYIFQILFLFISETISSQNKTGIYLAIPSSKDSTTYELTSGSIVQYYKLSPTPLITFSSIDTVYKQKNEKNESYYVVIKFTEAGGKMFFRLTQRYVGKQLGLVVADKLVCAPTVIVPIEGGNVQVANNFTERQAEDIIYNLKQEVVK